MRGGLPCLARKKMACHPVEVKNDRAKKNKSFFSKNVSKFGDKQHANMSHILCAANAFSLYFKGKLAYFFAFPF